MENAQPVGAADYRRKHTMSVVRRPILQQATKISLPAMGGCTAASRAATGENPIRLALRVIPFRSPPNFPEKLTRKSARCRPSFGAVYGRS